MNRIKRLANQKNTAGYFFTLPFIIGFFMFLVVPMGMSLYYSFCDYNILSPPVFTGLENFKHMLQDATFFKTLKVTFFFAFVSVPLKLLFALFVAMLLLKNSKLSGFLQGRLLPALHYRRFGSCFRSLEADVFLGWGN